MIKPRNLLHNFWAFKSLLDYKHENIHMWWVLDVNTKVCHLAFEISNQHIWAIH